MGLYEHFPYTNFHELNLDWMLAKIKSIEAALGNLDPDSIKEAVYEYIREHPDVFPFVTPQLFDAHANGRDDDSAAIQAAVDAGLDVYFPTDSGEIYTINNTITIPRGKSRKFYGSANARGTASNGVIRRQYTSSHANNQSAALFRLESGAQGIVFANLRFVLGYLNPETEKTENSGVVIDARTFKNEDKDLVIRNCMVVNAEEAIWFDGRGLEVANTVFGSCGNAALITWDPTLPEDNYSSRGISFVECRFHACVGDYVVRVDSGHAYGFRMEDCLADASLHGLLYAAEKACNWIINGNVIQRAYRYSGNGYLIRFAGGTENVIINNNVFRSSYSSQVKPMETFIYVNGDSDSLVISSNVFKGTHRAPVRLSGTGSAAGVVISNNAFGDIAEDETTDNSMYAAIQINNASQIGFTIVGNTCAGHKGMTRRLLSGNQSAPLTYSVISGNVCGSIPTASYEAATCSVSNNITNYA